MKRIIFMLGLSLALVVALNLLYPAEAPEIVIEKEPFEAPLVTLDKSVDDFYKFTKDSFTIENYQYHEFTDKIPVAV